MIPRSLRGRVAFAAALAVAVVIFLGGALQSELVERAERSALDDRLAEQADAIRQPTIEALTRGGLVAFPDFYFERPDIGTVLRVYRGGQLVLNVGSPDVEFPYTSPPGYSDVEADGRSWRLLTVDVDAAHQMQVAVPTDATEQVIEGLRRQVLLVAVVSAGLAATAGWLFGEVAMRPLGRMRSAAEKIASSRDLGVRVPDSDGPKEVDELAMTFNVMLERLQDASASTQAALSSSRAFAGNAAHEMRTPLTSMQANLEVLSRNPDLPRDQNAEIIAALSREQKRLVSLIDALHTLARGDVVPEDQWEQIDFADLVGVSVEAVRRGSPGVEMNFETPLVDFELRGWSDGLRVMVDNLLINAVRHGSSPDGATRVEVRLERHGDALILVVDDSGPGIVEEDREQIFERFRRGAGVRRAGSGLGLALVAQQARLHSGTVTAGRAPSGGARFVVTLPANKATAVDN